MNLSPPARPNSDSGSKPRLVVGVGASAGGIEACKSLLQAVPADSRLAFVVVMHLDPTRASHIADILQSGNRHLTVSQADGTKTLEANHVYVIAPNSKLSLADGTLDVDPLAQNEARGSLVDFLFSSLAEADGQRAVGVVLSGAGHDGTKGLKAIQAAGGLCLAQDPATAGSEGMPRSAIDADLVDAALSPEAIPAALAAFADDGTRPGGAQPREPHEGGERAESDEDGEVRDGFQRILRALGTVAEVNFVDYKSGTLARRTQRRMGLEQIESWDEYADRLASDRDELEALYQDVLIGVTEFCRDPAVWDQLAEELRSLIEHREAPGFRAWVPGCGTGEEAYTLAMLVRERMAAKNAGKVQIFATDLNARALAIARRGVYSIDALEQVGPERREQYFNQHDGQLRVDRSIRDCVTFAPHNALSDPPFSNMDLVSCRNLLIYLKPQAHDRLLKRLHFALRAGGLLLLGRAEGLGRQSGLFEEVSKHHSIFRACAILRQDRFHVTPRTRKRAPASELPAVPFVDSGRIRNPRPDRRIEQYVLRQHTPACVAINADGEIQHLYGQTDRYLVPPTGESRQDLLSWIRPGFYIRLRSAVRQAVEGSERLATEGQIEHDGEVRRVHCSIEPIPAAVGAEGLFLVTFRELADSARPKIDPADAEEPVVRELEQDLIDTRRELQATVEQLEAAGEEHRASHEELLSLNEELQSSNEELEASKEELEALNEEMNTINRELEQKNIELREANGDLNNLFLSTGIPTLFLDRDLNIRRFTSAATDVLRLVPSDIGRSIEHVKERFDDGCSSDKCREVLATLEPDTTEVRTENGRYFMRNILPYRTDNEQVDGVCITFSDITGQKQAAQASEAARDYAEAIIRTVRTPLLVLDNEHRIVSMNDAFRATFRVDDKLLGRPLTDTRNRRWGNVPKLDQLLSEVLAKGNDVNDVEVTSQKRTMLVNARRVQHGNEADPDFAVLSFEDVTHHRDARQQAERRAQELRDDAQRKDQWIAMLGHELRNPVGAVSNGVSLLKSGAASADHQQQVVQMMDRQIKHVSGLLDELLDAARIIAGKLEIERQPVDLAGVGEWAAETLGPFVAQRQHELTVSLPPAKSIWVRGDKVRLTEVLGNLLSNAAKYTEAGGNISLEITADDETAMISVRDTGIGIHNDVKESIFEIFTQGPRSLDRGEKGLGLGLPLVKSLVHAHGGEVGVFSEGEGQGSEFRVRLPRLAHPVEQEALMPDDSQPARGLRRRILIVDDLTDAAESLALLLQTDGHDVRTAATGLAALEATAAFMPEFALLDLGLPGMDGYELALRLRDDVPAAKLIAVTGYRKDPERLQRAGFDHHLTKPVDIDVLLGLLGEGVRQAPSVGSPDSALD